MPTQKQIRRGTATEHETFTGAIGEVTMDTTNNTLRVHDGVTVGGTPLARQCELAHLARRDEITDKIISDKSTLSNNATTINLNPDTRWTASQNGHIFIFCTSTAATQGLWVALLSPDDVTLGYADAFSSGPGQRLTAHLPIRAGQKIFYSISNMISDVSVQFVPTQGEL